jgi:hypothetical protein
VVKLLVIANHKHLKPAIGIYYNQKVFAISPAPFTAKRFPLSVP